ncbi:hypothetical protein HYX58_05810 [Candidatus Dependentiae bacterium]|nr:hypothetical protein [Candidatus Dependentiae bacterium]
MFLFSICVILFNLTNFASGIFAKEIVFCGTPIFSPDDLPWDFNRSIESQETMKYFSEKFKKMGYELRHALPEEEGIENADAIIGFDMACMNLPYTHKCICVMWEPPTVLNDMYDIQKHAPFKKFLTMIDPLVDNKKYFKYYFPQLSLKMIDPVSFEDKKLAVQISGNKYYASRYELYSERRKVISFFESKCIDDFDYYGIGWKGSRNYKGATKVKKDVLKNYKFSFCYENSKNITGYVSEKIFDCFIAGCVPIYLGADNVTDFIPEGCFIDRRQFANLEDVYNYIKNISKEEYNTYIANIDSFLKSDECFLFSLDYFVHTMAIHAIPDYRPEIVFDEDTAKKLYRVDGLRKSHEKIRLEDKKLFFEQNRNVFLKKWAYIIWSKFFFIWDSSSRRYFISLVTTFALLICYLFWKYLLRVKKQYGSS